MNPEIVTIGNQQYYKATWPRRVTARLIDLAFVAGTCLFGGGRFLVLTIPASLLYLLIGNAVLRGSSLGKALTGLVVLDARHGCPCSAIQEIVRKRYFFFFNWLILLFSMLDASKGAFDKPEVYVVRKRPLSAAEREESARVRNVTREKPAKLDLAAMRASLQKPGSENPRSPRRT